MEIEILLIPQTNKFLGTKSVILIENKEKVLGRAGSKVDITFNSKVISRRHAVFISKNKKLFLKDAGSSSGTFVNSSRLSSIGKESEYMEIKDGDVIQFGETFQQAEILHPCVQCKIYLAKSFNGDLIGPETAEDIEQEYQELCKRLDEKSNILGILEGRRNRKTGSIRPVGAEEYKRLHNKYSLHPLITDTDMALFGLIDEILSEYTEAQKTTMTYLLEKIATEQADSQASMFRRPSEIPIYAGETEEKPAQRSTDLKLGPIF
eukprot:NODE_67_length_23829_cov_0.557059.p11 type:complete len:264 gc:universal NODE_67_length_23829_cov_0.557059:614-1405(+)